MKAIRALLLSICVSGSLSAIAQSINWPVEVPPPGTNPAVYPTCRNDWMMKFLNNLNRAKVGQVDLLFQGDSITEGWKGGGASVWAERYGKLNAASFGISGDRTENVLWRLKNGEMAGLSPKLVVLMIGTNNVGRDSAAQIAEGIAAVVKSIQEQSPKSHILLLAVFPRSELPTDDFRKKLQEVNRLIQPLGKEPGVTYLDIGQKFLDPDGKLPRAIMPDFLHPNAEGYKIWADAIQPEIDKYFPPAKPAS